MTNNSPFNTRHRFHQRIVRNANTAISKQSFLCNTFYYCFVTVHAIMTATHSSTVTHHFWGTWPHRLMAPHQLYLIHCIFLTKTQFHDSDLASTPHLTALSVARSFRGASWSQCTGTHFPQSDTHPGPHYTTWCHGVPHLTSLCHTASPCNFHPAGTPHAPTHGWLAGWQTSLLVGTAPTPSTYPLIIPRLIHPPPSPLRPLTNWCNFFMTFVHNERDSQ